MAEEYGEKFSCMSGRFIEFDDGTVFTPDMRFACGQSYKVTEIEYYFCGDIFRIRFDGDGDFIFPPYAVIPAKDIGENVVVVQRPTIRNQ